MKKNTAEKIEPVSRLTLVREGGAEAGGTPGIPRRGRLVVDIDSITPDPANERKVFRGIEALAETVKQVGLIESPTVIALDDGRYMLTTGERRWRAAKLAGLKRINVVVSDPEDERKRRLKSLISNVQREDLGPVELANALRDTKDDNPDIKTNRDLAGFIGKSEQWVGEMLKVLSIPQPLQQQLSGAPKQIPYDVAVQIARVEDEKQQKELVKQALEGATVREIREKAKDAAGPKKAAKPKVSGKQKIKTAKAWVIIHHDSKRPSTEDFIEALQQAVKELRK